MRSATGGEYLGLQGGGLVGALVLWTGGLGCAVVEVAADR